MVGVDVREIVGLWKGERIDEDRIKENIVESRVDRLGPSGWIAGEVSKDQSVGWERLLDIIELSKTFRILPKIRILLSGEIVVSLPYELTRKFREDIIVHLKGSVIPIIPQR
jgi:hypothetical protein